MNDIQGANYSHPSYQVRGKPFTLQNGKVLPVLVHKLIGAGMAEVSSSGRTFIAKLDAPLEAGSNYLVRVNQVEDQLSLSLIHKITGDKTSKNVAQALIQHLHSQPANQVLLKAVMEMVNHKIQVTGELIQFASEQLTSGNLNTRLPVLIDMLKAHLPLSERVLLSLEAGKGKDTFSGLLNDLSARLSASGSDEETIDLIKKIQSPLQLTLAKQVAVKAMENALNQGEAFSSRLANFGLLKSLGILPVELPFQQMKEALINSFSSSLLQAGITTKQLHAFLSNMKDLINQKPLDAIHELEPVISKLAAEISVGGAADKKTIDQVVKLLFESGIKQLPISKIGGQLIDLMGDERIKRLESKFDNLLSKWGPVPESNEGKVFNMIRAGIEAEVISNLRGEELGQALKTMIRTFGFNLESRLHTQSQISSSTTLKEKLTQLILQHPDAEIQDIAERLVLKMNHPALISGEQSSIMNIVQQFPLLLFGRQTDLTVQWMGKEKEKGKIDSDHCRILFYLQLDSLQETLVDMHVQNRVISLSIWNEQESVDEYVQPFIPALKESLQRMDYQLSSVRVKKPADQKDIEQIKDQEMQNVTYSGVDLKI
ncbi:hypothetical protein LCM10_00750 [Rossellomorea aquimaris]|uniref:hypothetical protein n=1 Tax=Rossellomorea aquimaris TaxID=189382 RepID=UPI001CD63C8F|nr:hypothetical protein [Rossellomorea aquimaris]MCA1053495.1 hypothetical protein [Rossellomorea aquimaris]